jgi:hypothetical protein
MKYAEDMAVNGVPWTQHCENYRTRFFFEWGFPPVVPVSLPNTAIGAVYAKRNTRMKGFRLGHT